MLFLFFLFIFWWRNLTSFFPLTCYLPRKNKLLISLANTAKELGDCRTQLLLSSLNFDIGLPTENAHLTLLFYVLRFTVAGTASVRGDLLLSNARWTNLFNSGGLFYEVHCCCMPKSHSLHSSIYNNITFKKNSIFLISLLSLNCF